jgi:hypothetical protein
MDRTIVVEILDVNLGDGWPGFVVDYEDQDTGERERAYIPLPLPPGAEAYIRRGFLAVLELRGQWVRGVGDVLAGPEPGVLYLELVRRTVLAA